MEIKIGKEMVVKPLSKLKKKHRDRRGIITKIIPDQKDGVRALMKFTDTNRIGKVDVVDLDNLQ